MVCCRFQPGRASGGRKSGDDPGPTVGVWTLGPPLHHVRSDPWVECISDGRSTGLTTLV